MRTPKTNQGTVRADVLKTVQDSLGEGGIMREIGSKLNADQKKKMTRLAKKLDVDFLAEKAELIKDTMAEIVRNRKAGSSPLLQRNIWSSVDAVALHLDQVGFTPVFQSVAARIFKKTPLDDPKIVRFEWQLLRDVLGGEGGVNELGLSLAETHEVLRQAEQEKSRPCGLPKIRRRDFSLKKAFAEACGRPDKILEATHHSVSVYKVIAIAFIFVVNLVAAVVGIAAAIAGLLTGVGGVLGLPAGAAGVLVAVLTLVGAVVVLACGC